MGIPSYYSYIIKNHPNIIKKLNLSISCDFLYIDSNSIIYDIVKSIEYDPNASNFEKNLIESVCLKLVNYIEIFNNPDNVVIAFDGPPPMAKLLQQRSRRYKSQVINKIINTDNTPKWNTTSITPGTPFMNKLDKYVAEYFKNKQNVKVFTSESPGEGEHKLFHHLRLNSKKESNIVVYGLDADLIMLSLNHLSYSKNISLYRETPNYISNINSDLDQNENYLLDIDSLCNAIIYTMTKEPSTHLYYKKIFDYIFLGLMLGNDFMPHFPALNIRSNGIDILLETYSNTIDKDENIFDGKEINWKVFRKLVTLLSENETNYIKHEYKSRAQMAKKYLPNSTPEEKERKFQLIPTYERKVENYINPYYVNWQNRYYKMLFDIDIDDLRLKSICRNYLEGLEWNCLYYTSGCPDWDWHYKYDYPPLLCDLLKFIPYFKTKFIENKPENPVDPLVQLAYVLPISQLHLLPNDIYVKLKNKSWYSDDFSFKWSFCKYFWECHIVFEPIDIQELKNIIKS